MCVVFWNEKGDFAIPYVAETLCYDLPAREVRLTFAVAVSARGEGECVVGALHRRKIQAEGSMERWYTYAADGGDPIVNVLAGLYAGGLTVSRDGEVNLGPTVQEDSAIGRFRLAPRNVGLQTIDPTERYPGPARKHAGVGEGDVPFTPFRFGPLEAGTDWLYSFDLSIRGAAFESLVGGRKHCSVDGASVLVRSVLHEDLGAFSGDDPWYRFFGDAVLKRIVRPARYDVIITNDVGRLPACYRLCARTRRQYVQDPQLREKVAWFSSDDPDQDFIIDMTFEQRAGDPADTNKEVTARP